MHASFGCTYAHGLLWRLISSKASDCAHPPFSPSQVASTRCPELYAEPLLRLGSVQGVDSDELRQVLVERELAHYEREPRPLSRPGARHKVYKASYGGEVCVLSDDF